MNLKNLFRKKSRQSEIKSSSSNNSEEPGGTEQIAAIAIISDAWITFDTNETFNEWIQNIVKPKYPNLKLPAKNFIKVKVGFKGEEQQAQSNLQKMMHGLVSENNFDQQRHYKEHFTVQSEFPPMKVWASVLIAPNDIQLTEEISSFMSTFQHHLSRVENESPSINNFLKEYFTSALITEIASVAAEKMKLTQADKQLHSSVLVRGEIVFHVTTLPVKMEDTKEWFRKYSNGYTQLLDNAWNSLLPKISSSVWCHIIYGMQSSEQNWVHMALVPVRQGAPLDQVIMPIEFLTTKEKEELGLAEASHNDGGTPPSVQPPQKNQESSTVNNPPKPPDAQNLKNQGENKMSSEELIAQFLQQLGSPFTPFENLPGTTGLRSTTATYMGLQVELQILNDQILMSQFVIGYAPPMNTEQLLRHLMVLNSMMIGVYFCVFNANNAIVLRSSRMIAGLDFGEFKQSLDTICSAFMQNGVQAVQMFQISPQPTQ